MSKPTNINHIDYINHIENMNYNINNLSNPNEIKNTNYELIIKENIELKNEIYKLRNLIDTLKHNETNIFLSSKFNDNEELKRNIEKLKNENEELKKEIVELKTQIIDIKTENTDLKIKNDKQSREIVELKEEIVELKQENKRQAEEIVELKEENKKLVTKIDKLETTVDKLNTYIDNMIDNNYIDKIIVACQDLNSSEWLETKFEPPNDGLMIKLRLDRNGEHHLLLKIDSKELILCKKKILYEHLINLSESRKKKLNKKIGESLVQEIIKYLESISFDSITDIIGIYQENINDWFNE